CQMTKPEERKMSATMRMTRRRFVAASTAIAAAAILPSRPARAAEFEYKMGHSSPAGHPFHKRLLEVSDRIAKETAGRMTLTIFPASQLGGDNEIGRASCRERGEERGEDVTLQK